MKKADNKALAALTALTGATLSPAALGQEISDIGEANENQSFIENLRDGPFTVELSTGFEYDSNVSVIEVESQTAESDVAATIDLGVQYEQDVSDSTSFEIGYNFGQDLQADFTDFNTQTHRGSLGVSHDFGDVEGGASYQLIYSRLGGDGFLRLHRLSPYLATYVGDRQAYVRASYIYTDKNFIDRPGRDSDVHAGNAEVFYFINGLKTYAIAGYRYEIENAGDNDFDFNSHNVKLRLVQRIPFRGRNAKLRGGWRFEQRNYQFAASNPTSLTEGTFRDDTRHRFDASLELPINDIVYTELEYNHDRFDSNLPAADFTQNVVSFRIGGKI